MRVYVRKLFPHDITHEVSVRKDIVEDYFEGKTEGIFFEGKKSHSMGQVSINSATDPRFGGAFKSILLDEGRPEVNDILLISKQTSDRYIVEIVKEDDDRYFRLMVIFHGKERHAFIEE